METSIRPTITHRVRAFLAREGIGLQPWSGLDDTYAALYDVLNRRKDDPTFWAPLTDLLREVVAASTDPSTRTQPQRKRKLPAPDAELLASWDIEQLVRDLRRALPGRETGPGALGRFTAGLSTAVLGGFLLLGIAAAGCSDQDPTLLRPEPEASAAGEAGPEAAADAADAAPAQRECSLEPDSVLRQAIDSSTLLPSQRADLCPCLSSLGPGWDEGLTELFATGTPEQVAAALDRLAALCSRDAEILACEFEDADEPVLHPPPAPPPRRQARRPVLHVFAAQVAYKGVSFWTK